MSFLRSSLKQNFYQTIMNPCRAAIIVLCVALPCLGLNQAEENANAIKDFWKGVIGYEHITELTDATREKFPKDSQRAMIMHYKTWCGPSNASKQSYANVAMKFHSKVKFGAVESEQNPGAYEGEHPLTGVPTFYRYKNGSWVGKVDYSTLLLLRSVEELLANNL